MIYSSALPTYKEAISPPTAGDRLRRAGSWTASKVGPIAVRGRVDQVIVRELTQNGINAAPARSEIAITLRTEGGSAVFEVRDNGPGLSDAFISTVGESFNISQPVLTRGGTQGVGLGLAIASRHVEVMGGSLKFERNLPRGTAAIVEFPLAGPVAAAS